MSDWVTHNTMQHFITNLLNQCGYGTYTYYFLLKSDEEKQKFLGVKNIKMSDDNNVIPQGEKIEMPLGQLAPSSVKK